MAFSVRSRAAQSPCADARVADNEFEVLLHQCHQCAIDNADDREDAQDVAPGTEPEQMQTHCTFSTGERLSIEATNPIAPAGPSTDPAVRKECHGHRSNSMPQLHYYPASSIEAAVGAATWPSRPGVKARAARIAKPMNTAGRPHLEAQWERKRARSSTLIVLPGNSIAQSTDEHMALPTNEYSASFIAHTPPRRAQIAMRKYLGMIASS